MRVEIDTNKDRLNRELIKDFIQNKSYWAKGRTSQRIELAIDNSLCFGVYVDNEQVGFARVVSDFSIFAWVMDLFILEEYRGHGFGKQLMDHIINHPELHLVSRWGLNTLDAHNLYKQYGFTELEKPELYMELLKSQSFLTPPEE